jgi:hypothetical protein
MQSFDDDYLARREKQIQDLYMLRANSWACLITGLVLTLISILLMNSDHGTLGSILFVVSLLFEAGAIFMFASCFAQKAADRAFQQEYERMLGLYSQKPKRGSRENGIRLSDDGELIVEDDLDDQLTYSEGQAGRN